MSPAVLKSRIEARESGRNPRWYLGAAAHLAESLEATPVEDHVVDNTGQPAAKTAAEVLRVAGWVK